jgi:hypothetical protein
LKEHGIEVSVATLGRFIRRHKEQRVLDDGEDMKEAVSSLAKRSMGDDLRKSTLEAARQKLYEQVVNSPDPEMARVAYEAMLKEETALKKLELEQRKAAAMEEGVRLQRLRIEVMAAGNNGERNARTASLRGQRTRVDIESAPVIAGELPGPNQRDFIEGEQNGSTGINDADKMEIARLWRNLGEILNRAGRPEEKVLEARAIWEEGKRSILL